MRNITGPGLDKLSQNLGTEPIFIIEVDWTGQGNARPYADRAIFNIPGKILEVGNLDNVIDVLNNNTSQEISIVLDDTDGSIKDIMDNHDIHQRNVSIYQYFEGLDWVDKFLLFNGKISSPVTWSEAERSVSFTVISQLEDKEFGFSAEEGQFPFIPKDMVGRPWPVIFGKVLDCPALQVNKAVSGTTLCGVGIISGKDLHNQVALGADNCGQGMGIAMAMEQISLYSLASTAWSGVDDAKSAALLEQANNMRSQLSQSSASSQFNKNCGQSIRAGKVEGDALENGEGCNPVRILGGEDFPQNTPIELNINGGLFTGRMINDNFTISSRRHPDNEDAANAAFERAENEGCPTFTPNQQFDMSTDVPCGKGDFFDSCQIRRKGTIICLINSTSRPSVPQVAQHFWAEPGSRVVMSSDEPITYIVSITPGQVLAVKAYKQFTGERRLVNVPNDLWYVQTTNYGPITAVEVVMRKPLSTIVDQGWDDDIYVTFESTVGPNTVSILEYIIDNYTDLTYDSTSFGEVATKVDPFPMNFPILDRRNTIDVIKDIAYQARCAVWISNGVFYLKYLPEEPAADLAVTVADIENKSIEVTLTPTEDLVTKMVVLWRLSWADGNGEEPNKIILRHNVNKYGTKEEEYDFFCFNQPDIVLKAATFWLIRKSNTWKKISFRGFLNLLQLETFDTVSLSLGGGRYVAATDVSAIVEKASYDSATQTVNVECLTPVKSGTSIQYQFFWPKDLTITDTFPTATEIAAGNAGGAGIGAGATGTLPIGFTDGLNGGGTVIVGGPNVAFRGQSDRGDRTPGDSGFAAQQIIPNQVFAEITNAQNPNPDLTLNYVDPTPPIVQNSTPNGGITIDIRKTKIIDSQNPGAKSKLSSIIRKIQDATIYLKTAAKWSDGTNDEEFDFKFDSEGGKWGAGTAFLKDD